MKQVERDSPKSSGLFASDALMTATGRSAIAAHVAADNGLLATLDVAPIIGVLVFENWPVSRRSFANRAGQRASQKVI
jgi:hypothetical protein